MKLKPFLLDEWLNHYHFADPPIRFDLASSTGPVWTAKQVWELMSPDQQREIDEAPLVYCHGSGTKELRGAIGDMQGVDPDHVQIVTGAAEALLVLFFLAAEPGANVVLPFPGFPPFEALPQSFGIETRHYHLRPENQFRIDLEDIKNQVDRNTRLILVNSPHNPTGRRSRTLRCCRFTILPPSEVFNSSSMKSIILCITVRRLRRRQGCRARRSSETS